MQRFAIYGRVKAFVYRKELSAWIESFMLEINKAYKSFSVSQPSPHLVFHDPGPARLRECANARVDSG